jgi:hypothetical protein
LRNVDGHTFKGDFDPGDIQIGAYRYFSKLNKTFNSVFKGDTRHKGRIK